MDDQVAQDLAGGGVDHGDVEVLDEQDDIGSGVGSPDTDVAQSAGDAQGDAAGLVDLVVADAVVGVGCAVGVRAGLGPARVDGDGRSWGVSDLLCKRLVRLRGTRWTL